MNASKYLPMTETTYYILLSLVTPRHGYAIMQDVEQLSNGRVRIAAGTMYGALDNLLKQKLLSNEGFVETRRKVYRLTDLGLKVLHLEYQRMASLLVVSKQILGGSENDVI